MPKNESEKPDFDWAVTTFEGSRREQLRRWAQLPLENILLAIEEMQDIAYALRTAPAGKPTESARSSSAKEPPAPYRAKGARAKRKRR